MNDWRLCGFGKARAGKPPRSRTGPPHRGGRFASQGSAEQSLPEPSGPLPGQLIGPGGGPLICQQRGRLLPPAVPILAQIGNHGLLVGQSFMGRIKTRLQLPAGRLILRGFLKCSRRSVVVPANVEGVYPVQLRKFDPIHPSLVLECGKTSRFYGFRDCRLRLPRCLCGRTQGIRQKVHPRSGSTFLVGLPVPA